MRDRDGEAGPYSLDNIVQYVLTAVSGVTCDH